MRIICWQTILMTYHTFFFRKFGRMSLNLSSAAVVIGTIRIKSMFLNRVRNAHLVKLVQVICLLLLIIFIIPIICLFLVLFCVILGLVFIVVCWDQFRFTLFPISRSRFIFGFLQLQCRHKMALIARKSAFGVSDKLITKPAYSATETSLKN